MKGYDWHTLRDIPEPHGSGKTSMYANMGKSTKPDPNRKVRYPQVIHVVCLDSHNTSFFYKREDGTYYWHHSRKNKDDVFVDADELQLDLLGGDPILDRDYIMKAIL